MGHLIGKLDHVVMTVLPDVVASAGEAEERLERRSEHARMGGVVQREHVQCGEVEAVVEDPQGRVGGRETTVGGFTDRHKQQQDDDGVLGHVKVRHGQNHVKTKADEVKELFSKLVHDFIEAKSRTF